jgi:hypothetical protein
MRPGAVNALGSKSLIIMRTEPTLDPARHCVTPRPKLLAHVNRSLDGITIE